MSQLAKKSALITGGAAGLGKALADQLAADGWRVLVVDLKRPETTDRNFLQCDLSDRGQVSALVGKLKEYPPFDLVLLNAAMSATGKFERIPFHVYEKLVRLNIETPMVMASQLSQAEMFADKARLVFISSLSHFTGYPGAAVYSATKDAIAVYAKSIRKPFAKLGITVSCVFPGPMRTEQAQRHSPAGADAEKRMDPKIAASLILRSVFAGSNTIMPGVSPKLFAILGKFAPGLADRAMRKIIYEKLNRDVF